MVLWRDEAVVVTGATGAVGVALTTALAAAGARLALVDTPSPALDGLAARLGAHPVPGDCSTPRGVEAVAARARVLLGHVGTWVSQTPAPPEDGDLLGLGADAWRTAWEADVLTRLHLARALVPGWVERGRGRLVLLTSSAGLLTEPAHPLRSMTTHALQSFAEWLSATYAHRGVQVHAVCPHEAAAHPPAAGEEADRTVEALLEGVAAGTFLVLPHPQLRYSVAYRGADTDRWLLGLQRLQALPRGLPSDLVSPQPEEDPPWTRPPVPPSSPAPPEGSAPPSPSGSPLTA